MTFQDWLADTKNRYQEQSLLTATRTSLNELAIGAGRRLGQHWTYGRNVWDQEWDVLILVDACRHDLFEEVAPDYDWLPDDPGAAYSRASQSKEWMERHFTAEYADEMARTALISGNVFTSADFVDPNHFAHLDEVWKHSWDGNLGTVPAEAVTDAAIDFWRNHRSEVGADRMIVWYLQPHNPFIQADWSHGWTEEVTDTSNSDPPHSWRRHHESPWKRLRTGDLDVETLWTAYRDNLEYALDDIATLRQNLEAENVVLTSDHANCIGEYGVYGHPDHVPLPTLKRVPWVQLTAEDRRTYDPEQRTTESEVTEDEVSERLRALGYKK